MPERSRASCLGPKAVVRKGGRPPRRPLFAVLKTGPGGAGPSLSERSVCEDYRTVAGSTPIRSHNSRKTASRSTGSLVLKRSRKGQCSQSNFASAHP